MKNIYKTVVALASCLAVFSSCNRIDNNVCSSSGGGNEIRFGSNGVRVETKSFVETNFKKLQADGFKVAAVIDADNSVMFNSAVTYNSQDAVYRVSGESYYFPKEGTMSFYGVYPAMQEISVDGGEAAIVYSQNVDTDLVAAKATEIVGRSAAVQMTFDHLLSQVSITAKGENSGVDYKLKSVKITNADGGTYSFADDSWTSNSTTGEYTVYSDATGMTVSTSGNTAVGKAMSFVPGTVSINVVWECYNKGTKILVSSSDQSVDVSLEKGKRLTLNLLLPYNSLVMKFNASVAGWVDDDQKVIVMPEPVFTVNDEGKKVKFAPGNLYWDGSEFKFEEHQYDKTQGWNPNHVGLFFWTPDANVAVAPSYDGTNRRITDIFFAVDGGAVEGWTVLSCDEAQYLLENNYLTDKCMINGVRCAIIKPDGFIGEVASAYTAAEWAEAEKMGLAAFPLADCREGTEFTGNGIMAYWTSSSDPEDYDYAMRTVSDRTGHDWRDYGYAVRLVKVL